MILTLHSSYHLLSCCFLFLLFIVDYFRLNRTKSAKASMSSTDGKVILLTGGAGYIGTHCIISLVEAGYKPIIADNMCNATSGTALVHT